AARRGLPRRPRRRWRVGAREDQGTGVRRGDLRFEDAAPGRQGVLPHAGGGRAGTREARDLRHGRCGGHGCGRILGGEWLSLAREAVPAGGSVARGAGYSRVKHSTTEDTETVSSVVESLTSRPRPPAAADAEF